MESAEERRERLKRLREDATANDGQRTGQSKEDATASKAETGHHQHIPTISFRNYKPRDKSIASQTVRIPAWYIQGGGNSAHSMLHVALRWLFVSSNDCCLFAGCTSNSLYVFQVPAAKPRALDAPKLSQQSDGEDRKSAIDAYAPKKPHLDLKKDVSKSLRKLERATQRAIDELLVELHMQKGQATADGSEV
jgi:hypothetical protein